MFGTYFCYYDVLFLISKGTVSLDELGIYLYIVVV